MQFARWQRIPRGSFLSLSLLDTYVHQAKSSTLNQRGMERSPPPRVATAYRNNLHMRYGGAQLAPCHLASPSALPQAPCTAQVGERFVLAEPRRREWSWGKTAEGEGGRKQTAQCSAGCQVILRAGQSHGQAWTPITSHCRALISGEL